jgi:multimeric flavodoxin WrbA
MPAIRIISGSRNPEGQTARAIDALARGIGNAKGIVDTTFLPEKRIERCRQCEADGWGICRDGSGCVIDDDLQSVVDSIVQADGVVFATPVYFSDMSESLRAFLDRFRRFAFKGGGSQGITAKPALLLCVAGGGGGGAPLCLIQMEKITSTIGFSVRDAIPVRRQNLERKAGILEQTGKWFSDECASFTAL